MKETQTITLSSYEKAPSQQTQNTYHFESLNSKLIEDFDKETRNLTPIPAKHNRPGTYEPTTTNHANSIDEIYFEPDFNLSELQTVLRLLAKSIKYCETSLINFRHNNLIESDKAIIHIQRLLPELFCCRGLSESFGSIINSVQNALINNRGQLLTEDKILALSEILKAVRHEPFMKYEKAIDVIMEFEDHDFIVEPMGFEQIVELFR